MASAIVNGVLVSYSGGVVQAFGTIFAGLSSSMSGTPGAVSGVQCINLGAKTIRRMRVHLVNPVDAGNTLTTRLNVNGVDDTSIVLTMTAGQTVAVAEGAVALADQDLVAFKCVQTGLETQEIQSIVLEYEGVNPAGYLVIESGAGSNDEGSQALFTQNNAAVGIDNVDPSDPPTNRREYSWLPFETTVIQSGFRVTNAPVGTQRYRVHRGQGLAIGPIQTITGAVQTTVVTDLSAEDPIPALDPTDDTSIRNTPHYTTFWVVTGGNTPGAGWRSYHYKTPSLPQVVWHVVSVGGDSATSSFAGTNIYAAIVDPSIVNTSTNQAVKRVPMPAGTFRYAYAAWRGFDSTSTVVATLQKNGVDTAIQITMVGGSTATPYQATIDTTTQVSSADGDFWNWRVQRTAGAATTGSICLGVGFIPTP